MLDDATRQMDNVQLLLRMKMQIPMTSLKLFN